MSETFCGVPVKRGLMLDLNADLGVSIEEDNKVSAWNNQVNLTDVKSFKKQDEGRTDIGSGRPQLRVQVQKLNGHNSIVFQSQELVNESEDAFDHLITGSGYTWISVMCILPHGDGLKDVNSFFGNLRNTHLDNQGKYEGIWAGLTDDNQVWMGSRNAVSFGRWDENNPYVHSINTLNTQQYYIIAGRMGAGTGKVPLELYVNNSTPLASGEFPVNLNANSSKMAIGQERDATNHPGYESFDGEIARFLLFDRPISIKELTKVILHLKRKYLIQ